MITYLSRISFGIYFVHICVMTGVNAVVDNFFRITGFPEFAILLVSSLLISVLVIWIVSKNKVLGKFLFLIKE